MDVNENVPPFFLRTQPDVMHATPRVQNERPKVRGALLGGAETTKVLPVDIGKSLLARAERIKRNIAKLSKEEFDAVIASESAHYPSHDRTEWQNAYVQFLWSHMRRRAMSVPDVRVETSQLSKRTSSKSKRSHHKMKKPPATPCAHPEVVDNASILANQPPTTPYAHPEVVENASILANQLTSFFPPHDEHTEASPRYEAGDILLNASENSELDVTDANLDAHLKAFYDGHDQEFSRLTVEVADRT